MSADNVKLPVEVVVVLGPKRSRSCRGPATTIVLALAVIAFIFLATSSKKTLTEQRAQTALTDQRANGQAVHSYFLLDRTGSMEAMKDGVLSGYKKYVTEQQTQPGVMYHTLAQFDSENPFEIIVEATEIRKVSTELPFAPRAATPLYDAIDLMIDYAERTSDGSDDVIIVVLTDGHENASRKASRQGVLEKVERLKKRGWTFVFLGANIDSYATGGAMGWARGSTMNYAATSSGADYGWGTVSAAMSKNRNARRQPGFDDAQRCGPR